MRGSGGRARPRSSSAKSSRQWLPRVSSRASAACDQRGGDQVQVRGLPGLGVGLVALPGGRGRPGRRRPEPAPFPTCSTPAFADISCWSGRTIAGSSSPGPLDRARGLGQRRQAARQGGRDPLGEHQPLEQRVGRQPVGAVHAGAGRLAAGVQARHAGPAEQVGADAAAGVVRGRHDRDQVGDRIDAVLPAARQDRREPALPFLLRRSACRPGTRDRCRRRSSRA